jgi:hypothetical protein
MRSDVLDDRQRDAGLSEVLRDSGGVALPGRHRADRDGGCR